MRHIFSPVGAWRFVLFVVITLFVLWICDQNVPFAGHKRIEYTFGELNGVISQLRPLSRASTIGEANAPKGVQIVFEDPVYFDIKTPVSYENVVFTVAYQNHSNRKLGIGMKMGEGWNFLVKPFNETRTEDFQESRIAFDLRNVPRVNGKYTFLFSIPGLTLQGREKEFVTFSHMSVELERPPLITMIKRVLAAY